MDRLVIPIHDRLYLGMGITDSVTVRVVVPATVVNPPVAEAAVLLAEREHPGLRIGPAIHIERVETFMYDVDVMVYPPKVFA